MKYALLIYTDEGTAPAPDSAEMGQLMQAYYGFTNDITQEGINQGGEALHSIDNATTVRVRDGETLVTDGPFAETTKRS